MGLSHTCRRVIVIFALVLPLSACELMGSVFAFFEDKEAPLPGKRLAVLSEEAETGTQGDSPRQERVMLPKPRINEAWPQEGGSGSRFMGHLAASGPLLTLWKADIGAATSSERRLLARPVMAEGQVYTLDSESRISAFDFESGQRIWSLDVAFKSDDDATFGGGLAYGEGRIFATTGFADVVAIDAVTGEEIWRISLPAPMRAAPTFQAGTVFVVTIDNQTFALDALNGDRLWSHTGALEVAGVLGGASPAVSEDLVIIPYSSGEIYALRAASGREVWNDNLGVVDTLDPLSSIADIAGLPVVAEGVVFVISHAGQMVALDLQSGLRIWERNIGGIQTPWVAGDYLYVLTNDGFLFCLHASDGATVWRTRLPRYEDMEDREDLIVWHGPVLAGDRLIIAGSQGEVLSISPYNGRFLGRAVFSKPLRLAPSMAQQTVFLLDDAADLRALR